MNDERADGFRPGRDDHTLRQLLSLTEDPLPAPHLREHRLTEIHTAIHTAWFAGAPPTPDDLNRNPHPVDRWDTAPARPGPDNANESHSPIDKHWPWNFANPRRDDDDDDRPGDHGRA
jgi:hypothetical protein